PTSSYARTRVDSCCPPTSRVCTRVRAPELMAAVHRSKSAASPDRAMTEDHHRGPASTLRPRDQVTGVHLLVRRMRRSTPTGPPLSNTLLTKRERLQPLPQLH